MQVELKPSELHALLFGAERERERLYKNYTKRKTSSVTKALEISTLDRGIEVLRAAWADHILGLKESMANVSDR